MPFPLRIKSFELASLLKIFGNLVFLVFIIYTIVYAIERTTYIDSAWIFFRQLNTEGFAAAPERWAAFIPELFLFAGIKIGLPFKALVYLFSVSYILWYSIIWRLCVYKLNNPIAGVVILLGLFMGIRESFLHTVTEIHQVIVYGAMLFAVLQYGSFTNISVKRLVIFLVVTLILFTHPTGSFIAAFVLIYFLIHDGNFKNPFILTTLIIVTLFALWTYFHPANPYDAEQIGLLSKNSSFDFTGSHAFDFIIMHSKRFYWLPELALVFVLMRFALSRQWIKLGFTLLSVLFYLLIVIVTFRKGDSSIMLERAFLPAFFMINLALADILVSAKINKWIPIGLVIFFFVCGIKFINDGCLRYKKRVAYLDTLIQSGIKSGNDKFYLANDAVDPDKILVPWAFGTETLIYSKFKYDKCISITVDNPDCPPATFEAVSDFCIAVKDLNPAYFSLSQSGYQELSVTK